MTPDAFAALAKLLRLRDGLQKDGARLVLVDGLRPVDAARQVGVTAKALGNTLAACRNGLDLARVASGLPAQPQV